MAERNYALSQTERLILTNQFATLSRLSRGQEAKRYEVLAHIAQRGYAGLYGDLYGSIDDETPVETSDYVIEVLTMYRCMRSANNRLPTKERLAAKAVAVPGFDHNNEASEAGFARFFTEAMGRFDELTENGKRPIPNTHHETGFKYRAMLDAWRASPNRNELTSTDIDRILAAWNTRPA